MNEEQRIEGPHCYGTGDDPHTPVRTVYEIEGQLFRCPPSISLGFNRTTAPPPSPAVSEPGDSDHALAWIQLGLGLAAALLPAAAVIWAPS